MDSCVAVTKDVFHYPGLEPCVFPWRGLNKKIQCHLPPKPPCFILLSEPWNTVSVLLSTGHISRHLLNTSLDCKCTHTHIHRRLHHKHIKNTKHTHSQFRASVASSPLVPQTDRVIKSSLQCMQWQDSCTLADAAFAPCFCSSVATGKPTRHVEWFLARVEGVCVWLKTCGSTSAVKQIWHSDNQVLNCYSGFSNLKWGTCVYMSVGGSFFFLWHIKYHLTVSLCL